MDFFFVKNPSFVGQKQSRHLTLIFDIAKRMKSQVRGGVPQILIFGT
jgi:hypothetical protein